MSIVLQSSGGGSVTINEPATASNFTVTLPAATGTVQVSGNMPAFSAYPSGSQSGLSSGAFTKILFQTEEFDTNNNFASSRFTPTVAGYYQINSTVQYVNGTTATSVNILTIYKNNSEYKRGGRTFQASASLNIGITVSDVVYLNGSTDYVEIFAFSNGGTWSTEGTLSYFSGALVRAA
jgi:hypothetical protein